MTSTLQQEASRKLRLSSQQTMRTAQRLYENGYITYMRTDSTTLSESALAAARDQARELYGADSIPAAAPSVQPQGEERPGGARGDPARRRPLPHARSGAARVDADEFNLYDLIWKRTIASQMADARGQTVSVRIAADAADGRSTEFSTAGTVITFRGFLLAYEEGRDEPVGGDDEERVLPHALRRRRAHGDLARAGGALDLAAGPLHGGESRKALEERGIGRPSTYAAIMGTILDRGYVRKQGQALVPEFLAFAVVNLLERHFPRLVDYEFTARMEDDLDEIASGEAARSVWLARFYFGDDGAGLKEQVEGRLAEIDAREINTIELPNSDIVVRVGRYGPYLERGEARQTLPPDIAPDELTAARAEEILAQGSNEQELGVDPETGRTIALRAGRYGPYVTRARRRATRSRARHRSSSR